jgi:hypothetical protein
MCISPNYNNFAVNYRADYRSELLTLPFGAGRSLVFIFGRKKMLDAIANSFVGNFVILLLGILQ